MTLSISIKYHYAECHYAVSHFLIVMLSVIMQSVVLLNVVMLIVMALNKNLHRMPSIIQTLSFKNVSVLTILIL